MILASKYHCYGNDYLVLPVPPVAESEFSHLAKTICHPHLGLGADGCVLILAALEEPFELRIFNRDGSQSGMSGNGVRCACAYLFQHRRVDQPRVEVRTPSGPKVYELLREGELVWEFRSYLGVPSFAPESIPFQAEQGLNRVENYPLEVAGQNLFVTALSVGNPQCVVFAEELPREDDFERLGAALESHPAFPEGTNVDFVQVESSHLLRVKVWERGVGPTYSSGTGSCGAAVAALATGRAENPVQVHTATGFQEVEWHPGSEIILTGRTEFIADVQFYWRSGG